MEQDYNGIVGSVIRRIRESKGLSLRDLAEALNVTFPGLSKMEKGTQKIDMAFLMKVSDYFQVSVNELLSIEESNNPVVYPAVIYAPMGKDLKIREALKHVLDNYSLARVEDLKAHSMGEYVRRKIPKIITDETSLGKERYLIVGSVGQGQWASVPWVSCYDRMITTTATMGYYVVYLFKTDMTGVYVSLNQGWTYFREKYGAKEGRIKIKRTAKLVRDQLNTVPDHLKDTEIDLASNNDLGKGYENGHIYGRYYDLNSFPSSEEIISDFKTLMLAYQEIFKLMSGRSVKQFNDFLLLEDDNEFLEESEQEYQDTVNEFAVKETNNKGQEEEEEARERPEPVVDKGGRKRWPRSAKVAAKALVLSDYKCSYNASHETFISRTTSKAFMELHHFVPMSLQGEMICDLDRSKNLKTLCSLCHRAIHHGTNEVKSPMIERLYRDCRDELESVGIEITLTDLKKAYGVI